MPPILERKTAGLTVRIDRNTCMANAACVKLAPEVFRIDDETICAFVEPATEIERERLLEACRLCPVDALIVIDEDGQTIVP